MTEDLAAITAVQQWRRSVVRHWIVTMIAALGLWIAASAWALTTIVEITAGMTLMLLFWRSVRLTLAGRCPRCEAPIRFRPRIEMPPACTQCGVRFLVQSEDSA